MATSGAFNTSNQYVKYTISVTEKTRSDTDIANNRTPVDVAVRFYRTNTGYSTYGSGKVYCRIDGELYSANVNTEQAITSSGIVLFSRSLNITHEQDGTKQLTVSAWIDHSAPLTSVEQSYNQKLSNIPRASQPSCITWPEHTQDVGDFGDTISIHMNRVSSSFTHTVRYQFGSQSGTIATNVGTGTTWTIPVSLMELIPSTNKGSGTIYVDTYNGNTKIGTKWCGFTAHVPDNVIPTCTLQVLDATDIKDTYGNLVRGLSRLYIKVTGAGVYDSEITDYAASLAYANGKSVTYNGSSEITTDYLSYAGTITVKGSVTDSRGNKSTVRSATFTVLDYAKPQITSLVVHRCREDGTEDDNGEYVEVKFSAVVTSLNNNNSATYVLRYVNNTNGNVTTVPLSDITGNYAVNNYTKIFAADSGSSYTVEITVEDNFNEIPLGTVVSTAFTLFNIHKKGTGWAFGKVSEAENTVENALNMRQIGNSYAFQPSSFSGERGYTLLAVVTINQLNVNAPITFVINRRGALCPMRVYVRFASSSSTTDPALGSITYEGDNYGAFLVKASTSTWKLYVDNTSGWSNPCLQDWYTTDNQNARLSITFPSEQIAELPEPFYRATPAKVQSVLDFIYPVGSIYLAFNHTNPATLFGGTWARIENAFLWATTASGTIGQTGGEETHKLTVNEIPSHTHKTGISGTNAFNATINTSGNTAQVTFAQTGVASASTGGGTAHNNMPPYIQVSAWRRTA